MLTKLITYTIGSGLALFVATKFVSGVTYTGSWTTLAAAGFAIALLNLAIAPILRILSLPLRILTFNLFSLVIDMAMVWLTDAAIFEMNIQGIPSLFWTTVIVMLFNAFLSRSLIRSGG
jgi:putative membrane protein